MKTMAHMGWGLAEMFRSQRGISCKLTSRASVALFLGARNAEGKRIGGSCKELYQMKSGEPLRQGIG